MGLILDSSVVIGAERRGETVVRLIERVVNVSGDQESALSAVGLTELVHGLHRANTPELRRRRQSFLDELLADLTVYPYTKETALLAGKLDAEERSGGVVIPYPRTCSSVRQLCQLGFSVLTTNVRHFRQVPGLSVVLFH